MRVSGVAASVIVIIAALSRMAAASGDGDVLIQLNGGTNTLQVGQGNTIEVWIRNDAKLQGMTLGLQISCLRSHTLVSSYGSDGYLNEEGDAAGVWNFGGLVVTTAVNGVSPDTVLFGGAADVNHGLAVHSTYSLCYTLLLEIPEGQSPAPDGLCIDNVFVPPAGDWVFVDDLGAYSPNYCGGVNSATQQPDAAAVCFDICAGTDCGSCCHDRVGDANDSGEDEPTIGDISAIIAALFIQGNVEPIVACLQEADINQSGGANPVFEDITIGDISLLIAYLFISGPHDPVTNPSGVQLPECL